jgi:predicted alpha/beta-hydrolase family hydrolase
MAAGEEIRIDVEDAGPARGRWLDGPSGVLVLAHGAGAGMDHPFMRSLAERLSARGVATLRYEFPYITAGRPLPPRPPTLVPVVRSAVRVGLERAEGRPVWAGGKSMGGRLTSLADADAALGVDGICFVGFPLHPAGKPDTDRAEHLGRTRPPLRFVSGTRDRLARRDLLEPVVASLGGRAELHLVDGADHGFHVLVRSGRTDPEVLDEVADTMAGWIR